MPNGFGECRHGVSETQAVSAGRRKPKRRRVQKHLLCRNLFSTVTDDRETAAPIHGFGG